MRGPDSGKEFAPSPHVDTHDDAIASPGGNQFAANVEGPARDERATLTEGSAKEFSPEVENPEAAEDAVGRKGSGKRFEPGRHEL